MVRIRFFGLAEEKVGCVDKVFHDHVVFLV